MRNEYADFFNSLDDAYMKNNEFLRKQLALAAEKLNAYEDENRKLKELLHYCVEGSDKGEEMGRYVDRIKQQGFRPAYKKHASADAIVKIIHEAKITDLNEIADKLNVSYSTVYRRLKEAKMFPIDEEKISDYYNLFLHGG